MWSFITEFFKTPQGIAILATAAVLIINLVLKRKPESKPIIVKFLGSFITAIKAAEKAIPDTTQNKAAAKFDRVLQYLIEVFEKAEGRLPTVEEQLEIKEAIPVVHDELESAGTLKKPETE